MGSTKLYRWHNKYIVAISLGKLALDGCGIVTYFQFRINLLLLPSLSVVIVCLHLTSHKNSNLSPFFLSGLSEPNLTKFCKDKEEVIDVFQNDSATKAMGVENCVKIVQFLTPWDNLGQPWWYK